MQTLPVLLAALGAVLFITLAACRLLERARRAEARLLQAGLRLDALSRSLGLVARELESSGLSLLGLAGRVPADAAPGIGAEIEAEGKRLLTLAEETADHTAAEPGPRRLAENRVPIGPLLREALDEMALSTGDGARHWRVAPEADSLTLLADRRALRRALSQCLARAVRETRGGDRIAIRVIRAAETVALLIEDDGAGLPPGDLSPGTAGGTRGLSMGLSAARSLLRAHGGELTLESTPGIGARTWLTLPRGRVLEDQVAA